MKKVQRIVKDNRGAAMISVMIAVAFIAILASALLYMSYSNYKMKVVNYESKVNFYETESNLTSITTSIRNEVANSTTPLETLKDVVGCYEIAAGTNQYRYNPKKLAYLLDNSITFAPGEVESEYTLSGLDGDQTLVSRGTAANTPNFLVYTKTGTEPGSIMDDTLASNEQKIVLKDVVVKHTEADNGYVNQLKTDMVFRVSKTPSSASPGGVGEFSVLNDNSISTGGVSTRITFLGNSFIGPGTYTDAGNNVLDPDTLTAVTLDGDSYLAHKGEYMIVYGNIYLKERAVLHVAEGSLTVYGNIYISDNAVLMCSGNLYMMDGCNVVNNTAYTNSVIPSDLNTNKQTITPESYANVLGALGLDDSDPDNNGIVNRILDKDMKDDIENPGNAMDSMAPSVDLWGIEYDVHFWNDGPVNNEDADGALCFLKEGSHTFGDGANRNTTFISFAPLSFVNDKNPVLSQMGSAAFDYITTPGSAGVPEIPIGDPDSPDIYALSDFFNTNPTPNDAVNALVNNSINGGGGLPIIDTAVGYDNWTKE